MASLCNVDLIQSVILHLVGVIRSDLDEDLAHTTSTTLLTSEHVEESLGRVLETVVLDLLELEVAVCKLFRDGVVELVGILVLENQRCQSPSRSPRTRKRTSKSLTMNPRIINRLATNWNKFRTP